MHKILFIVGPTSTGKTSLALLLAKKYNGEIISADSRQVYIGMDIGTGKELPVNSKFQIPNSKLKIKNNYYQKGYYEIEGIKIWGWDIARPDQDYSVSHFVKLTTSSMGDILKRKKLPIIVGGTGLYISSIIKIPETINIPCNLKLRERINDTSVRKLQQMLEEKDSSKLNKMNNSDRNNPRRLIRAIEVTDYLKTYKKNEHHHAQKFEYKIIGLNAPKGEIYKRINLRIENRIKREIVKEIQTLLSDGYFWDLPSMKTLGYKEWKEYFEGNITVDEVIERWKINEHDYARRQMTWFKKMKEINWFDISDFFYKRKISEKVKEWYT